VLKIAKNTKKLVKLVIEQQGGSNFQCVKIYASKPIKTDYIFLTAYATIKPIVYIVVVLSSNVQLPF